MFTVISWHTQTVSRTYYTALNSMMCECSDHDRLWHALAPPGPSLRVKEPHTTLDFFVVLNSRRFIVGANPELKCCTTDEADTAHVVSELPTARKSWIYLFSRLRSNRHIPCVQYERATLPILNHTICRRRFHYSLSFALFCRRMLARQK